MKYNDLLYRKSRASLEQRQTNINLDGLTETLINH